MHSKPTEHSGPGDITALGQLGDGTTIDKLTPIQIGTDTNWAKINSGDDYSIAIKSDGTLWAWGYNVNGQLGDGTNVNKNTPTQAGTDTKWKAISGGLYHTLGVKNDGTLWSWGYNVVGELGDGTFTNRNTPGQVGVDSNWFQVAAGYDHSFGLKNDSTLWAWGYNNMGQLGDGTTIDKNIPVQVNTTRWIFMSGGHAHSLAIDAAKTIMSWGKNTTGQLGDSSYTNRSSPGITAGNNCKQENAISNINLLKESLKVYPNPAKDMLSVSFLLSEPAPFEICIMNTTGQIKMLRAEKGKIAGMQQIKYAIPPLNSGLYFLLIKTKGQIYVTKIVLE